MKLTCSSNEWCCAFNFHRPPRATCQGAEKELLTRGNILNWNIRKAVFIAFADLKLHSP